MDLDYLHGRYLISLQMAESAACDSSRVTHRKLAEAYATRIAESKLAAAGTAR